MFCAEVVHNTKGRLAARPNEYGLSTEQLDYLKQQISNDKSGADNAGETIMVPMGSDVKELSKSNRDMDYKTVIASATETIAIAYKVPLPLVVSQKQTLDNYSTAILALYDDAVFPLADLILSRLTILMQLEDGQRITYNPDQIPAVRMRRFQEAKLKNESNKFSVNEIRKDFGGTPLEDDEDGDKILIPVNLVELSEEEEEEPEVIIPEDDDEDEDEDE